MSTGLILLAAGRGRRMGRGSPKQFLKLGSGPLYQKSLATFLSHPSIREIVLVIDKKYLAQVKKSTKPHQKNKNVAVVAGGSFRGESVKNGFEAFSIKHDVVLVHDAARPLVDRPILTRVERAARRFGVSLAAWPLSDTLKFSDAKNRVKKTIPRHRLWVAQTPQGFRWNVAEKCLRRPDPKATDDTQLAEKNGFKVKLVKGSPFNFKVTYPHDLILCRALIS